MKSIFFCALAALLSAPACQRNDAALPVVSKVHTLSIHIREHETFNAVLSFLSGDLGLPMVYGTPWTPEMGDRRIYAAVSAGNINIEPCGPYLDIAYATPDFNAIFFGITFIPRDSAAAAAAELDNRGIAHSEPSRFMSVTDPALQGGNLGIGFIDLHEERMNWTSEDSAREELQKRGGGPLGVLYVEEIMVGYADEKNLRRWREFLNPSRQIHDYLFQIGDTYPLIRLVESDKKEVLGIVIKVRSLETAAKYLSRQRLLGDMSGSHLELNPAKSFGLRIIVKE